MSDNYIPTIIGSAEPTPAADKPIRLHHLQGSRAGTRQEFQKGQATLGRRSECEVRFDHNVDFRVSGRHARLTFDQGGWWLEDLQSANGTQVNGAPLAGRARLNTGDTVSLGSADAKGSAVFTVEIEGEAAPPAPSPHEATEAADLTFPCAECGAPNQASYALAGRAVRCSACGKQTPVRLPAIAPFRLAGPVESENAAPGDHAAAAGFLGKIKGFYRRFVEKKEVQRALDELQAQVPALSAAVQQNCVQLGRAVWTADVDRALFTRTAELEKIEGRLHEARQRLQRLTTEAEARSEESQAWLNSWQETFRGLETQAAATDATLRDADQRRAAAEAEVAALLKPRLDILQELGDTLTRFVQENRETPAEDVETLYEKLTDHLLVLGESLHPAIDGLTATLAQRRAARKEFQAAGEAHRAAAAMVDEANRRRTEWETAEIRARQEKEHGLANERSGVEQLELTMLPAFTDLGREAVERQIPGAAHLAEFAAASQAFERFRALEAQMAELQNRLTQLTK